MPTHEFVGASTPPPGEKSYYEPVDGPDTLWKWLVLTQCLAMVICGILIILRTYVRACIKRVWALEDWMSCFCFIALCIDAALVDVVFYHHGGTHMWDITPKDAENIAYWINCTRIWFGVAEPAGKITILLLYLRVFSPHRKSALAIGIYFFIAGIVLFGSLSVVLLTVQCVPRKKIWKPNIPGRCMNNPVMIRGGGVIMLLANIGLLLIPIKGLWALKMNWRRKLGIYFTFTVGVIGPGFGLIDLVRRLPLVESKDTSFEQARMLTWNLAELATGMMVICLPILPGLRQQRVAKPSNSEQSGQNPSPQRGSTRDCQRHSYIVSDTDSEEMHASYIELEDIEPITTAIATGGMRAETMTLPEDLDRVDVREGRIIKTITVEQSRALKKGTL